MGQGINKKHYDLNQVPDVVVVKIEVVAIAESQRKGLIKIRSR